jgi:hypothetical protein
LQILSGHEHDIRSFVICCPEIKSVAQFPEVVHPFAAVRCAALDKLKVL